MHVTTTWEPLTRMGIALLLVVSALVLAPAVSQAQEITPAQREEFSNAQKLYDGKDYAGALPRFEKLLTDTSSPNARLYVARCLRELGRLAEAYDQMVETVREARARAEKEAKYNSTRDSAAAELALLEPKVGHVVVAITDAPAETHVTVDGKEVARAALERPITVAPGKHTIEIVAQGKQREQRDVEVGGGESKTVAIALRPSDDKGDIKPPPDTPPQPTQKSGGEIRIVGIVAAAVGAAAFGTFGAMFVLADQRFATLEDECGTRCTDPKYADIVDEGKTFETVSIAMAVTGGVLIAAAIPMIIVGGPKEKASAYLKPLPGGAALGISTAF